MAPSMHVPVPPDAGLATTYLMIALIAVASVSLGLPHIPTFLKFKHRRQQHALARTSPLPKKKKLKQHNMGLTFERNQPSLCLKSVQCVRASAFVRLRRLLQRSLPPAHSSFGDSCRQLRLSLF